MNVKDVLTLENNSKYMIASTTNKNGVDYYYLIQVNNDESDFLEDVKVVKAIKEGNDISLEAVTEEDELMTVQKELLENID